MSEQVLSVDDHNRPSELVDRIDAHTGEGILHRAYTIVLKDEEGVYLAKRSQQKFLWPGYWDGTVASHWTSGERKHEELIERVQLELGLSDNTSLSINDHGNFQYKARYEKRGIEWEICRLYTANISDVSFDPDPEEVQEISLMSYDELEKRISQDDGIFSPWFKIAVDKLSL